MKNLSTQEILELLRTLEHRGVSREEVLKALLSDVEKHKEIGDFLVLRAQKGFPVMSPNSECFSINVITSLEHGGITDNYYDYRESEDLWAENGVKAWYDFGSKE